MVTYTSNPAYDNIPYPSSRSYAWVIKGGSTAVRPQNTDTSSYYVTGSGPKGNSLVPVINHYFNDGVAVNEGSIAAVGADARVYGATALSNASIEAVGSGQVIGGIVGFSGAIFAGGVTNAPAQASAMGPGTAIDPIVGSGGYALVGGGGNDFYVKGYLANGSGGLMSGGTFNPGSYYGVGNGGVALNGTIFGSQAVFSNGTSLNQLFVNNAKQLVVSNGLSSNGTFTNGAALINAGGTTSGATAMSGGILGVSGGTYVTWLNANYESSFGNYGSGTSVNDVVSSGGTEVVWKDGIVSGSTILSGGQGTILSGGLSYSPTIIGGTEIVSSAGFLNNGYVTSKGNITLVGGTAYRVSATNSASVVISSRGVGSSLSAVNQAGIFISANGTGNNISVSNGGSAIVSSGGSGNTVTIGNAGIATVSSGGYAAYINANQSGFAEIKTGGTGNHVYANSGGTVQIDSGASAGNLVLNAGGTANIVAGGVIYNGGTINDAGIIYNLPSGATADFMVASAGGVRGALAGTSMSGLYAAGSGYGLLTKPGASVATAEAGYDPNNTNASGGTIIVSNGGIASNVGAISGGTAIIASGGTVSGFLPINGGTATLMTGAQIPSGATVQISGASTVTSSYGGFIAGYTYSSSVINGLFSVDSGYSLGEVDVGSLGSASINAGATVATLNDASGTVTVASDAVVSSLAASGAGASVFVSGGGSANSLTAGTGASVFISSGATVPLVTLSGATAEIPTGVNSIQTISAIAGGTSIIDSGALVNSVFLSSGNATVNSGASINTLTIMSGASGVLMSGASVQNVMVNSGGWVSGAQISNNGSMTVASGGTALQTVVSYDAGTGSHVSDPYTMLQSSAYVSGATIVGADPTGGPTALGGLLTIASGATLINTSMGYNARIRITGQNYDNNGTVFVSNNILTVIEGATNGSGGQTWVMSLSGNYDPNGFSLADDGQGNTVVVYYKCFLPGSMIRTPKGEKAVERLRKGEQVCVYVDGKEEVREITAVIQRRARVDVSKPQDMAGWSVLVSKDAFGPGLPNKDLSVTPEHCFYFEGRFVPARMLINGTSIRYDYSQVEYDYYHVKTEPHSVIWANDVLTESWLDTDVQDIFKQEDAEEHTMRLVDREQLNWNEHAAAPLDVTQEFVKPLYDSFAERASQLGFKKQDEASASSSGDKTTDPAPYIRLENGETIRPQRHEAGRYLFSLPSHTQKITLGSRTFRPSEAVGPHVDDRRELGVLVGQISLWNGGDERIITRHLTDRNLKGWDIIEAGPHRWTKGEAELALHDLPPTGATQQILSIEVQAGGPYSLTTQAAGKQA